MAIDNPIAFLQALLPVVAKADATRVIEQSQSFFLLGEPGEGSVVG